MVSNSISMIYLADLLKSVSLSPKYKFNGPVVKVHMYDLSGIVEVKEQDKFSLCIN